MSDAYSCAYTETLDTQFTLERYFLNFLILERYGYIYLPDKMKFYHKNDPSCTFSVESACEWCLQDIREKMTVEDLFSFMESNRGFLESNKKLMMEIKTTIQREIRKR